MNSRTVKLMGAIGDIRETRSHAAAAASASPRASTVAMAHLPTWPSGVAHQARRAAPARSTSRDFAPECFSDAGMAALPANVGR